MKDGRLNADELKTWLDRKPAPQSERLVCLIHGTEHCAHDETANPDCPKCQGSGHYVEECPTFGWRMVECGCDE